MKNQGNRQGARQEKLMPKVAQPRCEYETNPLGIAEAPPRLSWIMDIGADAPRGAAGE